MKGLRSFGVLALVAAALGAYLYFIEPKQPVSSDAEKKDKAFTVDADKIEEFTVTSESGEHTTVRKSGADWQIVQPATAKPDSSVVSGITSNLASLEIQRVIDENPPDLAEYNLATPRLDVTFKAGGKAHRLQIGRKTPPGTDLYARLDDQKRVVLISSSMDTTFNRTTFDLRDKAVLTVDRDQIGSITVTTPAATLRLEKSGSNWKLAQPPLPRVDPGTVEGLVSRVTTLQMKSVAAQDAQSDLAKYGLDKPAATVVIGSGSSQATLALGAAAGEGAVYARDQSKPMVVTVESTLLDDLKKPAAEYRQKDLFDARAFDATRVELVSKGTTTAFDKVKTKNKDGQEQETWKQVSPAAKDVDQTTVENLLSAITQTRATSFVDAPAKGALDKPELTVSIKSNDGKRDEQVTYGRAGADAFATRPDEPGAARLDAATLDAIVKALTEIK